jgi:membrane protein implicated in regulation of membrane protease activity
MVGTFTVGMLIIGVDMIGADMVGAVIVSIAHGGGAIVAGVVMVICEFTGRELTGPTSFSF